MMLSAMLNWENSTTRCPRSCSFSSSRSSTCGEGGGSQAAGRGPPAPWAGQSSSGPEPGQPPPPPGVARPHLHLARGSHHVLRGGEAVKVGLGVGEHVGVVAHLRVWRWAGRGAAWRGAQRRGWGGWWRWHAGRFHSRAAHTGRAGTVRSPALRGPAQRSAAQRAHPCQLPPRGAPHLAQLHHQHHGLLPVVALRAELDALGLGLRLERAQQRAVLEQQPARRRAAGSGAQEQQAQAGRRSKWPPPRAALSEHARRD
jgi:hypothetical protein